LTLCSAHLESCIENICATKNTEKNSVAYDQCSWILEIVDNVTFIKNFIVGHSIRISMFNSFHSLFSVTPTRFASTIVMLKRFRSLKK